MSPVAENKAAKEEEKKDEQEKQNNMEEEEAGGQDVLCPLCQETFRNKDLLESHAMQIHSINSEGLQRLVMLMQGSHWLNSIKAAKSEESTESKDKRPGKLIAPDVLTFLALRSFTR